MDWDVFPFTFLGFEWDDAKNEANLKKHHIGFEDARFIFAGPVIGRPDPEEGEERWQVIGQAQDAIVFAVITERRRFCRIITARLAKRHERERYYQILHG